ncbi:hypothetical protein KUTeg_017733 [Tegillarca granosa]|uniref:FHA domain-containing protein n=1 Tax=Tegillarca granosa TaxID=220873 RepID=A0ABQ9EKT0_TEGGR|nr:hypothetical protein KUTeg_017733 [Tegillarca granosa]
MYYDYNTGYYYNAEKGLYYDPRTGTYFYYDQQTGEYQFHSQVDLSYYTGHCRSNVDDSQQITSRPQTNYTCDLREKLSHKKNEKPKGAKRRQLKEQEKRKHKQEKKDEKHTKKRKRRRKSRLEEWQEICQAKVREMDTDKNTGNKILLTSSSESQMEEKSAPGSSKDSCKDEVSMDDVYKDMPISELSSENVDQHAVSDGNLSNNAITISDNLAGQGQSKAKSNSAITGKEKLMNGDKMELGELSSEYTSDSERESSSVCTGESELESGEITDSESEESVIEVSDDSDNNDNVITREEDLTSNYPPCVRVIVTDSDCLDIGSLYIITVTGTAIGREAGQGILIPDINISKDHAFVGFDDDKKKYVIKDNGSQNGTFLNEERLSEPKCVSDLKELGHGDTLQFGCTRLLLHIHMGTDTCDECEPGIIKANLESQQPKEIVILTKEEKKRQYKDQMKLLKKKYGLKNAAYVDNMSVIKNPAYSDKAQERRKTAYFSEECWTQTTQEIRLVRRRKSRER